MAPALSSFRSGSQLDERGGELGGLGVAEWGERQCAEQAARSDDSSGKWL